MLIAWLMGGFVRYICAKYCTEEVIFQVKGQRQTKNTFEKKVFFACFFSAQNREWARKAGRFRRR